MKLSLAEKGPVRAPPTLAGPAARVVTEIASWPDVVSATHWHLMRRDEVDGADFYVGGEELGHIHLDGEVHLAAVRELTAPLVVAGFARRFRYGGSYAGWAEASITDQHEADTALWLFRLNYDRLRGESLSALLDRIAGRVGLEGSDRVL